MYPFSKVQKQFENGLEDSVAKFYAVIPVLYSQYVRKNLPKIEPCDAPSEGNVFHRYFSRVSKFSYPLRKLYWKKIRKVSTEKWRSSDKNAFYHCTSCGKFIGKEKHAVFDQLDRAHCSPEYVDKSRWHWTWDYEKEGRDYDI